MSSYTATAARMPALRRTVATDPGRHRVLRRGNARADRIAEATLDEVRTAMGMRY